MQWSEAEWNDIWMSFGEAYAATATWTGDEMRAVLEEPLKHAMSTAMDLYRKRIAAHGGTMTAERLNTTVTALRQYDLPGWVGGHANAFEEHYAAQGARLAEVEAELKAAKDRLRVLARVEEALREVGVPEEVPIPGGISFAEDDRIRWLAARLQPSGQIAELEARVRKCLQDAAVNDTGKPTGAYAALRELAALAQGAQQAEQRASAMANALTVAQHDRATASHERTHAEMAAQSLRGERDALQARLTKIKDGLAALSAEADRLRDELSILRPILSRLEDPATALKLGDDALWAASLSGTDSLEDLVSAILHWVRTGAWVKTRYTLAPAKDATQDRVSSVADVAKDRDAANDEVERLKADLHTTKATLRAIRERAQDVKRQHEVWHSHGRDIMVRWLVEGDAPTTTEQVPECATCPERGDFESLCCQGPHATGGKPVGVTERSEAVTRLVVPGVRLTLSEDARKQAYADGAEAMRDACLVAIDDVCNRKNLDPAVRQMFRSAIEGAKP